MFEKLDGDSEKMAHLLGPAAVDQLLLNTVEMCWIALPPDSRSLDELEKEMRHLLDRAFRNMREDEHRRKGK